MGLDREAGAGQAHDQLGAADRVVLAVDDCLSNRRLYGPQHAITQGVLARNRRIIAGEQRHHELTLGVVEGRLVCEGQPVRGRGKAADKLVSRLQEREVDGVVFQPGFTEADLSGLVEVLLATPSDLAELGGAAIVLRSRGVEAIRLVWADDALAHEAGPGRSTADAERVYRLALDAIERAMEQARAGKLRDVEPVRQVTRQLMDQILRDAPALVGLTTIQRYDIYTFSHSVNVGILAVAVGAMLKLPPDTLEQVGTASLLHDLGKVFIPHAILLKPAPLTPEEWLVIKRHPVEGARSLQQIAGMSALGPVVAYEHHMRLDGSGYPEAEKRSKPALASRIVAVVDCYDAMTAVRPYRQGHLPHHALREMTRLAGEQLDGQLVRELVNVLGIYPAGTCVRLNTNELAVVRRGNSANRELPVVAIVRDAEGRLLPEHPQVDLLQEAAASSGGPVRRVVSSVPAPLAGVDPQAVLLEAPEADGGQLPDPETLLR
ncbi:MAG: HD-GYP domain-containing protein [Armatimonadota bacterium]